MVVIAAAIFQSCCLAFVLRVRERLRGGIIYSEGASELVVVLWLSDASESRRGAGERSGGWCVGGR